MNSGKDDPKRLELAICTSHATEDFNCKRFLEYILFISAHSYHMAGRKPIPSIFW